MLESDENARGDSPQRRRSGWGRAFAVSLALCALAGIVFSVRADPAPRHASAQSTAASQRRDIEVCVHARHALISDPELNIAALHVSVRDGVASIEGEVPSEALRRRALELLGSVRGVREVQSDLRIVVPRVPVEPPVLPLPEDRPTQTRSQASPLPQLAPSEPQQHSSLPPPQSQQYATLPPMTASATPVDIPRRHGPAVALPTARTSTPLPPPPVSHYSVHLLPPSSALEPQGPPPAVRTTQESVRERVEQIRRSSEHFRFLQADVQGDTIVVQGENGAHVMELARALTHVQGIGHVIVKVRSSPE